MSRPNEYGRDRLLEVYPELNGFREVVGEQEKTDPDETFHFGFPVIQKEKREMTKH